ncbi:MAG: peptide chain release factor 1 [Candidatus Aenigmarchaeota archaeon]|nr:peptide chain release factor 1 [Candidatus Aenigmarchaeota archaeon]
MDPELLKMKRVVDELEKIRGRHTELVTFYIPAGSDFNKAAGLIAQEQALTRNVKNKTVRKNVLSALERISQELKLYGKLPENGLAIFCGNTSQEEGKEDIKLWMVVPPEPIRVKLYWCGQTFKTEPLKEVVREKDNYMIVCLDKSEATIALVSGKNITIKNHIDSLVPGKTRAGGQSSVRFSRVRDNLLLLHLQKTAALVRNVAEGLELKGIIISGPGPIKEKFLNEEHLPNDLAKQVIGVVDTAYTDMQGIRETLERGKDLIQQAEITRELNILKEFFVKLSKGKGEVVYGEHDTIEALRDGSVDVVLVSDDFDNFGVVEDLCSETGARCELISNSTPEGVQFKNIGGVGGILRYASA